MSFQFSARSRRHMEGVDTRLIEVAELAMKLTRVDFGIPATGGRRTVEQQQALYAAEKSNADGIRKMSKHQTGKALDVFAYVDGKASWDKGDLAQVAAAFLQAANVLGYQISWGGLWVSFPDYPHFQITG